MTEALGDRSGLSRDELDLLENQILPTAEKWLAELPGLADHGRKTLAYWGEHDRIARAERRAAQLHERRQNQARLNVDDLLSKRGLRSYDQAAE